MSSPLTSSTIKLLRRFDQRIPAPRFLSSFFRTPPENIHTSEEIALDIIRDDEEIAIAIQDLSVGGRLNENTLYTSKRIKPPIFDEEGVISSMSLISRRPGASPFEDPQYALNAFDESTRLGEKLANKIRRSIELMAAQVLQTGKLELRDQNNNTIYAIDFKARPSHMPTVAVDWGAASDDIVGDVTQLIDEVRANGGEEPTDLIFGSEAYKHFRADDDVLNILDNRRIEGSELRSRRDGRGATYCGTFDFNGTVLRLWKYTAKYKDPATGMKKSYVDPNKVILLSETGRLDLSFGAIPIMTPPEQRAMPFMPPQFTNGERGYHFSTNSWVAPNGKAVYFSIGTRPCTIPTAIDTFGCLTTKAA